MKFLKHQLFFTATTKLTVYMHLTINDSNNNWNRAKFKLSQQNHFHDEEESHTACVVFKERLVFCFCLPTPKNGHHHFATWNLHTHINRLDWIGLVWLIITCTAHNHIQIVEATSFILSSVFRHCVCVCASHTLFSVENDYYILRKFEAQLSTKRIMYKRTHTTQMSKTANR